MRESSLASLALVLVLAVGIPVSAQLPGRPAPADQPGAAPAPPPAQDPLGRTSPYGTVVGFIRAAEGGDFNRSGEFLDTRLTGEAREELARSLSGLMDIGFRVDLNSLSRNPDGRLDDGIRRSRESVGEIVISNDRLEVVLERVERGNAPPIWLFSGELLRALPDFAARHGGAPADWLSRHLPSVLTKTTVAGVPLHRLIITPVMILLALAVAWPAPRFLALLFRTFRGRALPGGLALSEGAFKGPIRLLVFALLTSVGANLGFTALARLFWSGVATVLGVIAVTWLFQRTVDVVARAFTDNLRRGGSEHGIAAVQLARTLAKTLAGVVGLLVILNLQGVDLTAAITGLGIGGLAIAFAAQKTIENLFGTVTLVTDQTVRVGDFCRVGDTRGTIENIGMRSTKIRTLDRTVVSVPNGQLASMVVENFAPRDKIWFRHAIGLRYETTADQLRNVLNRIRTMLVDDPRVEPATMRVRFVKFGASSLDLEVFAYVLAKDFTAFLGIQEELLLRIMDIIDACGSAVAFPSQTTYLTADKGHDALKNTEAVTQLLQSHDSGRPS